MPRTDSDLAGILIQETNSEGLITLAQYAGIYTALPTTASKFAVGALVTVSTNAKTYFNAGTVAVPSWNAVADVDGSEIADDAVTDAKLANENVGQVRTATATVAGATTGTLTAGSQFVTVTSSDANHIIILPAPAPGTKITLINGATGYKLRSSAPATIGINGGVGASAESAIGATTTVHMTCVSATAWTGFQQLADGTLTLVEVAA